jgi:hypothetical protein
VRTPFDRVFPLYLANLNERSKAAPLPAFGQETVALRRSEPDRLIRAVRKLQDPNTAMRSRLGKDLITRDDLAPVPRPNLATDPFPSGE